MPKYDWIVVGEELPDPESIHGLWPEIFTGGFLTGGIIGHREVDASKWVSPGEYIVGLEEVRRAGKDMLDAFASCTEAVEELSERLDEKPSDRRNAAVDALQHNGLYPPSTKEGGKVSENTQSPPWTSTSTHPSRTSPLTTASG